MSKVKLLGELTVKEFFEEYWEKKPYLVKGAFSHLLGDLASPSDLTELLFDKDFETRVVIQEDKEKFTATPGPLSQKEFNEIQKKKFTLICHNLNLLAEPFYRIQKEVSFLPDWAFDDIMATYSQKDTTVGAHIDNYNVFIFQGMGTRKWELELNPNKDYIEGLDIKILKEFNPEIEWNLEAGDLIYIPPKVAHRGTSTSESISYSIGFKSLDYERLVNHFMTWSLSRFENDEIVPLPFKESFQDKQYIFPKEILKDIKTNLKEILTSDEALDLWLSHFLTAPREEIKDGETLSFKDLKNEIGVGAKLYKDQFMKFVVFADIDFCILTVSEKEFKVSKADCEFFIKLFEGPVFDPLDLKLSELNDERIFIILSLIESGILYLS